MELGADFDDDLFSETRERNMAPVIQGSYKARICQHQWFEDPSIDEPDDMHSIHKYRGDAAFYNKQFDRALACYDTCLGYLYTTNVPMLKDVLEAKVRCYIHMGDQVNATEAARELVSQANNYDQKTSALHMMAGIHRRFDSYLEELQTVQDLLTLHSTHADLWFRLSQLYLKLSKLQKASEHTENSATDPMTSSCEENISTNPDQVTSLGQDEAIESVPESKNFDCVDMEVAYCTCLIQARLLLRNVQSCTGSFVRERNLRTQEEINRNLDGYKISRELQDQCIQFLNRHREQEEEESYQSDSYKLEMLKQSTPCTFERVWFSWKTNHSS